MKAKIKQKKVIAKGTLLVEFELVNEEIDFQPGQFFFVTLPKLFYPDERGDRRHFTIINSPKQKNTLSFATRLRDSGFKKTLEKLPLETVVEVGPIRGSFVLPKDQANLVFIAGGIGITPYIAMLKYISDFNLNYKITLLYSNSDEESTAFLEELKKLENSLANFKLVLTMTQQDSWPAEKGRIDSQLVKKYLSDYENKLFFVSGPPAMVEATKKELLSLGIKEENLKSENFTGY